MKFLVMILMLSSILFGVQKEIRKQIILGSFLVEENAKRALEQVNKEIKNDAQLQKYQEKYAFETINTVISGYTVVSINVFESFTTLLNTMNVLKKYYGDAFVLKYPTKNIVQIEQIEDLEEKAKSEQAVEDIADELKRAELKKLLETEPTMIEDIQAVEVEQPKLKEDLPKEDIVVPKPEVQEVPKKVESVGPMEKAQEGISENILYLAILGLLVLIAAGIVGMKIASNRKAKQQEADA